MGLCFPDQFLKAQTPLFWFALWLGKSISVGLKYFLKIFSKLVVVLFFYLGWLLGLSMAREKWNLSYSKRWHKSFPWITLWNMEKISLLLMSPPSPWPLVTSHNQRTGQEVNHWWGGKSRSGGNDETSSHCHFSFPILNVEWRRFPAGGNGE